MAYQFSGGMGGRTAGGRSWRAGGYREGRIYADGGSEEDERNVVPSHHEWQVRGQNRQRASSGATTRMNSSPPTTQPGTQSPSQPQRDLPGTRNFSLFGGVYTWSKAQEDKDARDPNFNGGAGKNGLKPAVVAGKPVVPSGPTAPASSAGQLGLEEGESYGTIAAEFTWAQAGNPAMQAAASKSAGGLTRTGEPVTFTPSSRGVGIETSGAGVGALFGQKALPEGNYYVPTSKPYMADTPGMAAVDVGSSRSSPGVHPLFDVSFKNAWNVPAGGSRALYKPDPKRAPARPDLEINEGDWFSKLEWKPLPGVT